MARSFRRVALFVCLIANFGACAQTMSDSAFRAAGSIRDQNGEPVEDCELGVLFEGDSQLSYVQKIDSDFMNTFTVEPGTHRLKLIVRCDSQVVHRTEMIEIKGIARYESPIVLGVIKVVKEP